MPVMSNALLHGVQNVTNRSDGASIANLEEGGQLGIGPQIVKFDASTPLVFSPAVAIVTHIPTMFNAFDGMGNILKALMERHAKTITNVSPAYTLETAEAYILPDGQSVNTPTKTKRAAVTPNATFAEVNGNLVHNFWKSYMSLINNPDTHYSHLASLSNDDSLDPFVFSTFCFDMVLINFDCTMLPKNIIDCVFLTNVFPTSISELGTKREIGVSETPERSIDFSAIIQHNNSTYKAGVAIAESLQLHTSAGQFDWATTTDGIESSAQGLGVESEIQQILSEFTR